MSTFHQSCETLPYGNFIEIILGGNLSWLIISGQPTPQELITAWEGILTEYSTLVKSDKSDNIFDVFKKIKQAEFNISLIDSCLKALKIQYDQEIAEVLNERGFGIVQFSDDREVYLKSLYAIETSAKTLIILLNQYKAEYKRLSPESTEQADEMSRIRYEKELAILSKFQGYRIVKEKITVLEYCAIVNTYLEYVETAKREKNAR